MTTRVESFKELIVWQRSIELVGEVYKLAQQLPAVERFGLASQIRRSAVSIPTNIAEGTKRKTLKDYVSFLRIANGSAAELETLLIIVASVYSHIHCQTSRALLMETQKMLTSMIGKLKVLPISGQDL